MPAVRRHPAGFADRSVVTIELIGEGRIGAAVQAAWIENDVPQ